MGHKASIAICHLIDDKPTKNRHFQFMANSIHPRLRLLELAIDSLIDAARETGLQTAKLVRDRHKKSFRTLKPGPDTPLWNELRRRVAGQVVKRGEQSILARFLGIPRQRVHLIIKAGSASPDAERTLLLLAWVIAREQGHGLS
jgi:hypothetical protein